MVRTRRFNLWISTAGFLLASCMFALPAMSQEVFTWVDEEGVTHFGHAATSPKHALPDSAKGTLEVRPVTVATDTIAGATVVERGEAEAHTLSANRNR